MKRAFCCFTVLFLIYYRCPPLLVEPRFWAEEGAGFFSFAFSHTIGESFFAAHYGYYSLLLNLVTMFATFVPLESAPFVTTYAAFFLQFLASCFVIFYDSPIWNSYPKKLLIAGAIQLLCPMECWLTTTSCQYFTYIIAFFILLESDVSRLSWRKWTSRVLLIIAGLTGPSTTFLLPVYFLKSVRSREREDWLRALILLVCAFVQAIAFLNTRLHDDSQLAGRFDASGFDLQYLVETHLITSIIGKNLLPYIYQSSTEQFQYALWLEIGFMACYVVYLLIRGCFDKQRQLIVLAFVFMTIPPILLSLNMLSSPRAAYTPAIILVVLIVAEFNRSHLGLMAKSCAVLVLSATILFGLLEHRFKIYYSPALPRWEDEVKLWRLDNNHRLAIWPQFEVKQWDVELTPKDTK